MSAIATFDSLCGLTSFVSNIVLRFDTLAPEEVSLLCDVFSSGAEIERIALRNELPLSTSSRLGAAMKNSEFLRSLSVGRRNDGSKVTNELACTVAQAVGPRLERLSLRGIDLDRLPLLREAIAGCSCLEMISLYCCAAGGLKLAQMIAAIPSLVSLKLASVDWTQSKELTTVLKKLPNLKSLRLRQAASVANLIDGLSPLLGRLETFDLKYNTIGDEKISALIDGFLPKRSTIQKLSLIEESLGPAGEAKLAQLILRTPRLSSLVISGNPVALDAATSLGKFIGTSSCANTLSVLDLSRCSLGEKEILALLLPMNGKCSLSELKLYGNNLGDSGARAVAENIIRSPIKGLLRCLNMAECRIGRDGAYELAQALIPAKNMCSVEMYRNPLGRSGAVTVLSALSQPGRQPMELVNISDCGLGDADATASAGVILRTGCRNLFLYNNKIQREGVQNIVDAVCKCHSKISRLNLGRNPLGRKGAECIARGLIKPNWVVEELIIQMIEMEDLGAKMIAAAIRGRNREGAIKKVILSGNDCSYVGLRALEEVRDEERLHGGVVMTMYSFD